MYCSKCGAENNDESVFCYNCGTKLIVKKDDSVKPQSQQQDSENPTQVQEKTVTQAQGTQDAFYKTASKSTQNQQTNYRVNESDSTLRLVAFILNLISTIAFGLLIIPLAWAIPMTVHSYGIYKGKKPNTTAFGVCDLIFVNIISGILLLVSSKS